MKPSIKIILVDDHQIIRDGLSNMIQEAEDIILAGSAADYEQALELIRSSAPDVVITDLSMPGRSGIELIRKIHEQFSDVRILVLSMYVTEDYIFSALKEGAMGYLPKQDTTKAELLKAIRTVNKGSQYFSDSIAQMIARSFSYSTKKSNAVDSAKRAHDLTNREREILRLYADGFSNQEISSRLNISVRTVETHKNNIMQKYNFRSTVEMVKFAIRNNLSEI
ncbi:MAG: response regulator transcription factor [Bacteroidales bacterium]|nr:response regulator transcription factor [Bacteroidales bacterium]MDD4603650.1 response regulator transcription factor [Bacteroidales bacterium]